MPAPRRPSSVDRLKARRYDAGDRLAAHRVLTCYTFRRKARNMQTNVHIDTKNLKPSPEHRIKGSGYSSRNIEVRFCFDGVCFSLVAFVGFCEKSSIRGSGFVFCAPFLPVRSLRPPPHHNFVYMFTF